MTITLTPQAFGLEGSIPDESELRCREDATVLGEFVVSIDHLHLNAGLLSMSRLHYAITRALVESGHGDEAESNLDKAYEEVEAS